MAAACPASNVRASFFAVAARRVTEFNPGTKPMEIRRNISGSCHELMVSGRIDGNGAHQLETEILASIRDNADPIYVNLAQVTLLCSAGLRALLQYWRQMKNSNRTLLVTRPSPEAAAILQTTGFQDLIIEKV